MVVATVKIFGDYFLNANKAILNLDVTLSDADNDQRLKVTNFRYQG